MRLSAVFGMLVCGLGGCAGAFSPQTDATSPVAPRVQQLVDANRVYPSWETFPATSEPLPTDVDLAQRVNTLRATGGALGGEVSALQWQETDADAFAQSVQSRIDASQMSPASAQTAADIEAYAETLRQKAKAPPPIDQRP